ncbi:MAG: hypothetical protein L3J47_04860 [Sulfurovum sp.]|nr:hypothetical protein [Sulfurovum sp.]
MKHKRSLLALIGGSVLAAFLAGSCCLTPLLFLLFGVSASSLSFLKIFAPYHTYFAVAATVLLLYLWGYYLFKVRRNTSCSDWTCRYYLRYLAVGTVLAAVFLSYPYWAGYLIGE